MTDVKENVDLGMMPARVLPDDVEPPLFFRAEMDPETGDIRPTGDAPEVVEEQIRNYAEKLAEHTDMSEDEALEAFGLD